jgi:hypothetical protein
MIDNVSVGGALQSLFAPNSNGKHASQELQASFEQLIDMAEELIEAARAAEAASAPGSVTGGVTVNDQAVNVNYKFDWIPTALVEILAPPDGYTPGAHRSQLTGFNHDKISPGHSSSMNLKYVSARVFEQINVNDSDAVTQAVARLNEQGFNATAVGNDKIDFNDGQAPVDVIRNASGLGSSTRAWQWNV